MKKGEKLLHCTSFSHFFNKNINVLCYEVVTSSLAKQCFEQPGCYEIKCITRVLSYHN